MHNEDPQVSTYFDQYEDLALAIIDDKRPNFQNGLELSNIEMVAAICEIMHWEDFDLFAPYDFEDIYTNGELPQILAFFYLAHLRHELFYSALQGSIGDRNINIYAKVFSEYWYNKLQDRYNAIYTGQKTEHKWVH